MERGVRENLHAPCGAGEKLEIISNAYLLQTIAVQSLSQNRSISRNNIVVLEDVQMEFDFIWVGLGIAIAGYFIGNGLKNFKNPDSNAVDGISGLFDLDDEHELIKESDVHLHIGISKEDAKSLIQDHPEVPHIIINNKLYYPKAPLRAWLKNIGK
jgi:hypothetical protein